MKTWINRYDWKGVALIGWPYALFAVIVVAIIVAAWAAVPAP